MAVILQPVIKHSLCCAHTTPGINKTKVLPLRTKSGHPSPCRSRLATREMEKLPAWKRAKCRCASVPTNFPGHMDAVRGEFYGERLRFKASYGMRFFWFSWRIWIVYLFLFFLFFWRKHSFVVGVVFVVCTACLKNLFFFFFQTLQLAYSSHINVNVSFHCQLWFSNNNNNNYYYYYYNYNNYYYYYNYNYILIIIIIY